MNRVAIFGVGLLGGSLGLALRDVAPKCTIVGYGHRLSTLEQAKQIGAIDELSQDPAAAATDADWIILCTPVGLLSEMLQRIAPVLSAHAIVTDVGSTKRSVVRAGESLIQKGQGVFVGSHPMAGSEKRGIEFARADLFRGARCIVTPTDRTPAGAIADVESFWQMLGMSVVRMSPDRHDRLVCDVSHLPHAVAAALVAMQQDEALAVAGQGFMDATRVAGGDGGLWRDILLDNRDNVADACKRLRENLDHMLALLEPSRQKELTEWLDRAAARRAKLSPPRNGA